jgi:N utilization substance protein B
MSRKLARELTFKVVFSTNFQNDVTDVENLIENLVKDNELKEEVTSEDRKYIEEIAFGVLKNTEELDEQIKKYLKGWTMDRIGKTDLAILRLAIYEILFRDDIPYKVSINEAVELAKVFCDDASPAFINGVLAGIVNSLS